MNLRVVIKNHPQGLEILGGQCPRQPIEIAKSERQKRHTAMRVALLSSEPSSNSRKSKRTSAERRVSF